MLKLQAVYQIPTADDQSLSNSAYTLQRLLPYTDLDRRRTHNGANQILRLGLKANI